jgi:hypothetical protein
MKPLHRRGSYERDAKAVTDRARADPTTRCMSRCTCQARTLATCTCHQACGRTLAEHPHTKTGRPPTWDAGHAIDGRIGGVLRPEIAGCGRSAGATLGNRRRQKLQPTRQW